MTELPIIGSAGVAVEHPDTARLNLLIQLMLEDESPFGGAPGISLRPPMNGHGWRLYGFDADQIAEGETPAGAVDHLLAASRSAGKEPHK